MSCRPRISALSSPALNEFCVSDALPTVLLQIHTDAQQRLGAFAHHANSDVAVQAEQPAHLSGRVIVVNLRLFTAAQRRITADAQIVLRTQHRKKLIARQTIHAKTIMLLTML